MEAGEITKGIMKIRRMNERGRKRQRTREKEEMSREEQLQ